MYEDKLKDVPKDKLVVLCSDLLSEMWNTGVLSNHAICKMIREMKVDK